MTEPKSSEIKPFNDRRIQVSKGLVERLGFSKALILEHIWFTFTYHYDNKDLPRFERPDHPGEGEKSWVYFTVSNFQRHVPLGRTQLLTALAELERDGWIQVHRQNGKRTLYRPGIQKMCLSSVYRDEGAGFQREPDRYVDPSGAEGSFFEPLHARDAKETSPETGPVRKSTSPETGPVPVRKLDRYQSGNWTGFPTLRERIKENPKEKDSARETALEVLEEGDGPGAEPGPDPAYEEEGTGGDDPVVWEDDMGHEERVEAAAQAYLEQPMGKVQFARVLLRFKVTMDEVRQRVAEIQTGTPPKTSATARSRGGGDDDKGNPAGSA